MTLSWNEIKERAVKFSKEWENTYNEEAEAKPFLVEFFNVFGISQRKVATFEHRVKKLDEHEGYIDMLWKGTLLIEMKSRGKNLKKAYEQARDYLHGLPQYELPKYILVSDFERFRVTDLEEGTTSEFLLKDLVKNVHLFGFIAGYQKRIFKEEDPVNIEAAELMGKLHDSLKAIGYTGHDLERYLVRLLFCLFADDTGIFEKGQFQEYIVNKTNIDGSDLPYHLAAIFNVLNIPREKRLTNLDEALTAFPYVNGKLFEETLPMASFDSRMRQTLLECCTLNWSKISPAIFGSLFQSVMDEKARRNLGAHYTSEKNILKVIKPLFLDSLWKEFERIKNHRSGLIEFHKKIASLRFLDPACGCGNFLIITYREIREIEFAVIKQMNMIDNKVYGQQVLDVRMLFLVDIDKYYGIECDEFATMVATVAMWMMDHQMNMKAGMVFGKHYARIPLKKSANIIHGNALQLNWDSLLNPEKTIEIHATDADIIVRSHIQEPPEKYKKVKLVVEHYKLVDESTDIEDTGNLRFNYIMGNPPFVGKQLQSLSQKNDMAQIFRGLKGMGILDYVTAWYIKAAQYIQSNNVNSSNNGLNPRIKAAFVSTNSIAQGEQVGVLWNELFNHYKIKIHFAHRTFKWSNEAKGVATVHVVIIGFSNFDIDEKFIYEYEDIKGEPHVLKVRNINPYLIEGKDLVIISKDLPICKVPLMFKGSQPTDGGNFLFTDSEYREFIKLEPNAKSFIKPFISAHEFINGIKRWCLWLKDIHPAELRSLPNVLKRIEAVKNIRLKSTKAATVKWAQQPTLFTENRQPNINYILVPSHSSENRNNIPIDFLTKDDILNNSCFSISNANFFHFGILNSQMHMAWVKYVCGRLKSDYRYSNSIVYNNFPWPENPTDKQIKAVEDAAQKVLDIRAEFPGSSLADLYDTLTMPPALVKAHQALDKAVDHCYRHQPFISDNKRIEYLFDLYDKYTAGLFGKEKKSK